MTKSHKNDSTPRGLKARFVLNGCDSEVRYLIFHRDHPTEGEIVVYIDPVLDLDWECDSKAQQLIDAMPLKKSVRNILNGVAVLEPIVQNWPNDLKLTSKRLLGEAIASVLCDDVPGAESAIKNAREFLEAKGRQVSRYWTLQSCLLVGGIAMLLGLFYVYARAWITVQIGNIAFLMSLCFWAGCAGALLFVIMRLGRQPRVDSTAERHLHYLEGLARIAGGGIAGVLVGGMIKGGLILPLLGQTGGEKMSMIVAAMIAGASERLAAGIITKVENNIDTKQENSDVNN